MITLETNCGTVNGLENDNCYSFLGIPFASAKRFEYAQEITSWESPLDATRFGAACPQFRTFNPHLEDPTRYFYYHEFRDGQTFDYDENNCLNLNIYTPKTITSEKKQYPVIIFIHGGGFDSCCNSESPFDGEAFAKRGIITVFINYRVGILGYITHPEIQNSYNRNGNFGLDDQLKAIKWVKNNIEAFGGNPQNITLMGQSAGAISIQYLCLNSQNKNLFQRAVMMSGGGKFPEFSLPKKPEIAQEYWLSFMNQAGISSFGELKTMPLNTIFDSLEKFREERKDNIYYTMPVIDGILLQESVSKLIKNPLKIDYMIGYTNCDMFAPALAFVGHRFIKKNGGYLYYFDINAKGDDKRAFHSSDLRYMFNTLNKSWRPYKEEDYHIADLMEDYLTNFAATGNPNGENLPNWKKTGRKALHFRVSKKIKMTHMHFCKLLYNLLTGGKQI